MELYDSEEEQLEAIKKWFNENGKAITIGLVVGIACVLGWNGWQSYQSNQAREASDLFQELLKADENSKSDSLAKIGERIVTDYPTSIYADYAGLFLAKQNVEAGELDQAREKLEHVVSISSDPAIRNIARLRLLRVLLAEGKAQEALDLINELAVASGGKFEGAFEELKGDAYVALAKEREARSAYERASELGRTSKFLELKIQDLPVPRPPE